MGKIVKNGVTYSGSSDNADNVKYNNNVSNLDATNVQEAIDKLDESVDTLNSNLDGFSFRLNEGTKQVSTDGGQTWENFSSGAELLWTNPAPKSSFKGQTVSLDLSSYDCVLIELVYHTTYYNENRTMQLVPKDNATYVLTNAQLGTGRRVTVNDSGVIFGAPNNEKFTIPYKIYGFKGVIEFTTL